MSARAMPLVELLEGSRLQCVGRICRRLAAVDLRELRKDDQRVSMREMYLRCPHCGCETSQHDLKRPRDVDGLLYCGTCTDGLDAVFISRRFQPLEPQRCLPEVAEGADVSTRLDKRYDDTQLSWMEWNAKVDQLLEECGLEEREDEW